MVTRVWLLIEQKLASRDLVEGADGNLAGAFIIRSCILFSKSFILVPWKTCSMRNRLTYVDMIESSLLLVSCSFHIQEVL